MVTARLAQIAENELREKGQIESNERDHGGKFASEFRIQPPGDFGPPIMKTAHEAHDHSAYHDVMEMRDHEVGIMHVNVDSERGYKQTRQSADGEKANKSEGIQHRSGEVNRAFVQCRSPIKNYDAGRDRHQKAQDRENHS